MKSLFETFIVELIHDVPLYIYEILISLAVVGIVFFIAVLDRKKAINCSLKLLLGEYLFLTYSNTVFFRPRIKSIWHKFTPFWSYKEYWSGESPNLLPEIIMNIAGFVPLGFLMIAAFQKLKWWQVILTGFLISMSIESIQYFFQLGIAEFDDIFNNTLGITIGYSLYVMTNFTINKIRIFSK